MSPRPGRPNLVEDNQLLAEAERRWAALEHERPELAEAIALQRRLVGHGLALAAAIDNLPLPGAGDAARKLNRKHPILSGAAVNLDAGPFEPFVLAFCDDLAQGDAGRPAVRLRGTLERGEIDIASLLTASLMRQQTAIRMKANQVGVAPDVLWLVAELGAAPLALQAAAHVPARRRGRRRGGARRARCLGRGVLPGVRLLAGAGGRGGWNPPSLLLVLRRGLATRHPALHLLHRGRRVVPSGRPL